MTTRLGPAEANTALDTFIKNAPKIDKLLSDAKKAMNRGDDSECDAKEKKAKKLIEETLFGVCTIVRALDTSRYEDAEPVLTRASGIVDDIVESAYGNNWDTHEFMPSFAHTSEEGSEAPLVSDTLRGPIPGLGAGAFESLCALMKEFNGGVLRDLSEFPGMSDRAPYDPSSKPHTLTTSLARFRKPTTINPSLYSISSTSPLALSVYQGRCSIVSTETVNPVNMSLPQDSPVLALAGASGWKERAPFLSTFNVVDVGNEDGEGKYRAVPNEKDLDVPLADVAYSIDVDPERKLVWVADGDRAKSFRFSDHGRKRLLAVHTLRAPGRGPIALLNEGAKFIRGGKGEIAVWDVDELPTHGENGSKRIGKKVKVDETWRDDPEEIEASEGTHASTTVAILNPTSSTSTPSTSSSNNTPIKPSSWVVSPSSPSTLIAAKSESYGVISIDLAPGSEGKIDMTYIGHGGTVTEFSTSKQADPRGFVTGASDGIVRLWDVREPTPRLSFNVGEEMESCGTVCYVHVQGVPVIFTAGTRSESIKVWDPRASTRNCIYELSTGNNCVTSLAWHAPSTTLYAATQCTYMDRMGRTHDYRAVRKKRTKNSERTDDAQGDEDMDDDEEDEDEEDEDEDWEDESQGWPKKAFHDEQYFGYVWDCGDHRLIKYTFGEDADPTILPTYGNARPGESGMFGW